MEIQRLPGGNFLLVAVPDEKTEHMARMVGRLRHCNRSLHFLAGWVSEIQVGGFRLPNRAGVGQPEQGREEESREGDRQEEHRGSPFLEAADCRHDGLGGEPGWPR